MKTYRYIHCENISNYDNWEIIQIIPGKVVDMAVIMKKDEPIQSDIYLKKATTEQLLEELHKRLESK